MPITVADLEVRARADVSDAQKKLGGLQGDTEKAAGGIRGKLATIGPAAGKAFTAGAAAAGVFAASSIEQFGEFDQGMREVFTLLPGISGEAMTAMKDQVIELAGETGKLPNEVIPALYQAISAGVPQENVFEFLTTANKAAVGGVASLETAVDGISSVVNAYGADILSAGEASDIMFSAVKLGKTNFDELSASLFQVVPTAAGLGVEFGDVAAALAAMTAQGTPTSVATTQLRQLFVELSKDGSKLADTFEGISGKTFRSFIAGGGNLQEALQLIESSTGDLNTEFARMALSLEEDVARGFQDFPDIANEFRNNIGATDEQIQKLVESVQGGGSLEEALADLGGELGVTKNGMTDLFGSVEAASAAMQLTGKGTEKFSAGLEEMGASAGATDVAFGTMESGVTTAGKRIAATFAGIGIKVGGFFEPIAPAVLSLNAMAPAMRGLISPAKLLGGGLGALGGKVLPKLVKGFAGLGTKVLPALAGSMSGAFSALVPALGGAVSGAVTGIGGLFAAAMPLLAAALPFLLAAAIIAGIILLIVNPEIRDAVFGFIGGVIGWIGDALAGLGEFLGGIFGGAFEVVATVVGKYLEIITFPIRTFVGFLATIFSGIAGAAGTAWDAVSGIVGVAIGVITAPIEILIGIVEGMWDGASAAAKVVWDAISGAIGTAVGVATGLIQGLIGVVSGVWDVVSGFFGFIFGESDKAQAKLNGIKPPSTSTPLGQFSAANLGGVPSTSTPTTTSSPSRIPQFQEGSWDTPGGLAFLHPREMVLPPDLAESFRRFMGNGGGAGEGGGTTITQSIVVPITGLLRAEKPSDVADALRRVAQLGYLTPKPAGA